MLDVMTLVGTRPEAIKMAPVLRALDRRPDVRSRLVVTGQHRELLDEALATFELEPDHDLAVMRPDQTPNEVMSTVLERLQPLLAAERPDWVLVQGDTTSAVSGALAAFHAGIRVGHVEGGLRTYAACPYPEETNRRMLSLLAEVHFAPTHQARAHLVSEGIDADRIVVTGNTVIDALHAALELPYTDDGELARVPWGEPVALVTAHRRESWGAPLDGICAAVRELADGGRVHVVFPRHPNPRVHAAITARLGRHPQITLTPPLGYAALVHALWRSTLVLTDSGGLQEEAAALGKPVLVLRDQTDRPEAVDAGVARLVGTDTETIVAAATQLLTDRAAYAAMARASSTFGDGHAAGRIVTALLEFEHERASRDAGARSAWQ